MNHWQNFYHDASAEELDDFTVIHDYSKCSTMKEANDLFALLNSLIVRAYHFGWRVERTEVPSSPSAYYKWRFSLRPARS